MPVIRRDPAGALRVKGAGMHRVRPLRRVLSSRHCVATFEKDRVCAAVGCATRLSIYNPTLYCAVHAPPGDGGDLSQGGIRRSSSAHVA